MRVESITELAANTPHLRLKRLFPEHEVWIKLECFNPAGSIKDRIGLAMIGHAEENGLISAGGTIIEPTSGNTGIGLAMAGAIMGYRIVLVMPETMSVERMRILRAYGAELVLTSGENGMKGAIEKANSLLESIPGSYMPMQFENTANPAIHEKTTAREILADFPEGVDVLIGGVGTGGHISGVGRVLKQQFSSVMVVAAEPADSAVIGGGTPGKHLIQGIGAGFIPQVLDMRVIDRVVAVNGQEAYRMTRLLARREGLLAGISSGASLAALNSIIHEIPTNSTVMLFAYDRGDRYLTVEGLWH